jgi:hypothetical protein
MKLRIIKTKVTDGVKWAVVDDHSGWAYVTNLESEAEAEAFIRDACPRCEHCGAELPKGTNYVLCAECIGIPYLYPIYRGSS